MNFFNKILKSTLVGTAIAAVSAIAGLSSCNAIYEDLDECPQGLRLRFIYDCNMEFANAFPSQVDCLTLLIYDEEDRYVATYNASRPELENENYRMTVDLPKGKYHLIAYGGMDCAQSSFHFVETPANGALLQNVEVEMNPGYVNVPEGKELHPLFYGSLDATVEATDTEYREETVPMMKDTNNLRILLQHIDGSPVDCELFDFSLTDDNTLMNYLNAPVPTSMSVYAPWTQGQVSAGLNPDGTENILAYAEFSFARLVTNNSPILRITLKEDGREVLQIPLINYLSLLKSDHYLSMSTQEYLDRENRWSMIFLLDKGNTWVKTHIIINDWIVRINHFNG